MWWVKILPEQAIMSRIRKVRSQSGVKKSECASNEGTLSKWPNDTHDLESLEWDKFRKVA